MAASAAASGEAAAAKPLQGAMKLAKGALELDAGDRPREAYLEYLKSISFISQALLEEAAAAKDGGDVVMPDTAKMLKVAEQCLERAKSSIAKLGRVKAKLSTERSPGPAPVCRHRRVLSDEGGKLAPFLPPEMFQKLQTTEVRSTKKELTPLEEASLQNQKLKAAYEARLARLNPSQAMQKTSLTLSLQRQMMENLVIAKAREETQLQRKMEERRLRLQEAANRRFSSNAVLTPEEQEQRAIYAAILEYEQDHEWPRLWKGQLKKSPNDLSLVPKLISHLLSFADHPICQLLKKLQCSVYNRIYPLVSRSTADWRVPGKVTRGLSLSSSLDAEAFLAPAPEGPRLRSSQSLHSMFSVQENNTLNLRHSLSSTPLIEDQSLGQPHPLGHGLPREEPAPPLADRESSFEDLEQFLAASEVWPSGPQAPAGRKVCQQEQLKVVVKDIHNAIDRLLSLTLLAFEGLNTAASKDQCVARLEEAFFAPLWTPLLAVYRNVFKAREVALGRSMELYRNTTPSEMGISAKLLPQGNLPRGIGSYPYCAAVQELMLIPLGTCPQKKLDCIVRTLRVICECAEEYWGSREGKAQPASAAIGADDLLPILSYVVLKSNLPQLVSECAALEEFIHEGYLIGEEGYCLTSLQSALSYVESLHRPALSK